MQSFDLIGCEAWLFRLVANGKKSSLKRSSEQKIVEYSDLPENYEKNMPRKPMVGA